MENPHFALYKESKSGVTKDGHTMVDPDIARELNRKSYLEENKLKQEKEIDALKAHVSELRNRLVYFVSDNFEFNEDSEYLHDEIEGLLEQTPAQSLAEHDANVIDVALATLEDRIIDALQISYEADRYNGHGDGSQPLVDLQRAKLAVESCANKLRSEA
jgi:hypothetical protein